MIRTLVSLGVATVGVALIRFSQLDLSGPAAAPPSLPPDRRLARVICERIDHAWITEAGVRRCGRCGDWHFPEPWETA